MTIFFFDYIEIGNCAEKNDREENSGKKVPKLDISHLPGVRTDKVGKPIERERVGLTSAH